MVFVVLLQSSVTQSSWTFESFYARSTVSQDQSTAANNWSEQMPEFQFNNSNWTTKAEWPIYLTPAEYCEIAFKGILIPLLCVVGFLTNVVTILGLRRVPEKDNATIWLLKTLAVVDNVYLSLFSVFCSTLFITKYTDWIFEMWTVYLYIYVILQPLILIVHCLIIWIVVLITVDRYLAVCKPMHMKWRNLRRMKVAVKWLVVLIALLNAPAVPEAVLSACYDNNCHDDNLQPETSKYHTCLTIEQFRNTLRICNVVLHSIIASFVPMITLIVLNVRIGLRHLALTRKRRQMSQQMIRERSLTKTLVIVVGVFVVCQMPETVIHFMHVAGISSSVIFCPLSISHALVTLNSALNFLIYCLSNTRFRRIFSDLLSCQNRQRRSVVLELQ